MTSTTVLPGQESGTCQATLELAPNGPLLFRDPRPFNAASGGARTLPFPNPSVTAGAIRTLFGKKVWKLATDQEFKAKSDELKRISVAGPLLAIQRVSATGDLVSEICLPCPANAMLDSSDIVRPSLPVALSATEGCNLPSGLRPVEGTAKPAKLPQYWPLSLYQRWLMGQNLSLSEVTSQGVDFETDRRTHVAIDPATGTNKESMLFATESISFLAGGLGSLTSGSLIVNLTAPGSQSPSGVVRLGGEGRFVQVQPRASSLWPAKAPAGLADCVTKSGGIVLYLVTPGLFSAGWRPVSDLLDGLELVAAKLPPGQPRWNPLSGWDLVKRTQKPLRRMVPSGAAYYFRVKEDCRTKADQFIQRLWMQSLSDHEQDVLDGFSLAVVGCWEHTNSL